MTAIEAPESVKAFEERLLQVAEGLPKRLRQCADYVASNQDRIAVSTVAEMAEGAGVQPSAFMRFCQIMGFSGFSEMQRLFRDSYVGGWPDYTTRLDHLREKGDESASSLLAEFVEAGRSSLEMLLKSVDTRQLDEAVSALAGARTVHIVGLRRSFPIASYLAYAFEKMKVPAVLHSAVGGLGNISAISSDDALIAITFSPYSTETLELAETARANGIPVVALSDSAVNPLRKSGATLLTVTEIDFGAFRSLSATLCLAITLAVAVGTRKTA
ncbi:MurR/RpiR family transcriptional regulator [Agrobacterium genomosp. 3]|uniref:MurR/RpiR family transcriptional regulator n=3 Tax=Agrobacterium TaxID=357 RepID=A0AAE6BQQ5_AGRTU|nr:MULTISPECIES: MurR/RpiR family transcriptional regulator [Rhizobium/Agrobacterium group]MCA1865353.1 MurR/RpiR family transcriptional regulator [Agrobacterium tomkonis]KRA69290.1 RpiR family transcriptional regulator [Rhizobium sp. Root651]MCA1875432.1 MurR/RpiR family transcriptional regulator [Agrobacterium tumefaciens]MCA1891620.1 MurR/RpiR family transcriptional regulator [Agrobacterium tomkonis]MCA2373440.1 MurR/RpiR family transcriptional regulator [Agrobacterium tomkonis CIP 111-78]